jgi:hypothetical protein
VGRRFLQEPHGVTSKQTPFSKLHLITSIGSCYYYFKHTFENLFLWRMGSSGMLHLMALVRTDVSEELSTSFIRVTRISELGTTLAVTSNRRTLRTKVFL